VIDSQDDVLILIIKCNSSTYFTGIRFDGGETYSCGSKVYIFYRDQISWWRNLQLWIKSLHILQGSDLFVEKPTAVDQKSTYFTGIRFDGGETYSCGSKSLK
jgi:hypothetical protein